MQKAELITALGLMSGTSLDGIDLALVQTDGHAVIHCGAHTTIDYTAEERDILRTTLEVAALKAVGEAATLKAVGNIADFQEAEALVTQAHITAVQDFLARQDTKPTLIGFHGQTILHRPQERLTVQLGDGAALAAACDIDVVGAFRQADIAAGGEGAPLAPLFHAALLPAAKMPAIIVNIGGVANLTYCEGEHIIAFDTGTGNALIDDWMCAHTTATYDQDGKTAATGTPDMALVNTWLAHPFFSRPPPKSLDRLDFANILDTLTGKSPADGAATLTAFTAHSIALGIKTAIRKKPKQIILCGGGRHNTTLRQMLAAQVNIPIVACEEHGWQGNALEAQAFAWLAVRSVKGLPLSLPTTTGVRAPQKGGQLFRRPRPSPSPSTSPV